MQIKSGQSTNTTCAVTNGNNTVIAAAGSDWTQALAGSWFVVAGTSAVYLLAVDAAIVSGAWNLTLTVPYAGTTNLTASYVIHKDFGSSGEPILAYGDTEFYPIQNRQNAIVAARSLAGGGGGGVAFSDTRASPSDQKQQKFNPDQDKYHTFTIRGPAGAEYIEFGTGET